ncbi:MAG: PKD domain-containing protein [Saprospiraceae bacterium]|nr:PKD domain-containing protein [Saprospiraceae bacterium]
MISGITCNKFEDNHDQICFKPYIDYITYFIDPIEQTIKIDSVTFLNGSRRQIRWDFGDGGYSTLEKPTHKYQPKSINESYKLSLRASNECGESIWYKTITIGPCLAIPSFDFNVVKDKVTFNNTTKVAGLNILGYKWEFGDGQIIRTESPGTHTFLKPGKYITSLTVSTDCGENTIPKEIIIDCFKDVVCNNCIKIIENGWNSRSFSLTSYTGVIGVEWNFGDGSNFVKSLSHTYTYQNEGRYTVIATISNECTSQSFKDTVFIAKPNNEYKEINLPNLYGSNSFHQIVYFNGGAYVLNSVGYFYACALSSNNVTPLPSTLFSIDPSNKLKKDAIGMTLWNIGSTGSRKLESNKWEDIEWNGQFITTKVNDLDCNIEGHYLAVGLSKSIVYNTISKYFFRIRNGEKYLAYYTYGDTNAKIGPTINLLDDESFGLIHNKISGDMYFINSSGIVVTNSTGVYKRLLSKTNVNLLLSAPKKILVDFNDNIWSLMKDGSLLRTKLSTLDSKIIWSDSINDFDVFPNSKNETEVLIAGNGILKHLSKN